jgi:hypothetical protein
MGRFVTDREADTVARLDLGSELVTTALLLVSCMVLYKLLAFVFQFLYVVT